MTDRPSDCRSSALWRGEDSQAHGAYDDNSPGVGYQVFPRNWNAGEGLVGRGIGTGANVDGLENGEISRDFLGIAGSSVVVKALGLSVFFLGIFAFGGFF